METEKIDRDVARQSARRYIPISLGVGALFYAFATLTGDNTLVARIGGAIWVTLLSFIVSTPLITARIKRRQKSS